MVVSGLVLQVVLALLVLRWAPAADALEWVGNQVSTFVYYSKAGSDLVFGEASKQHAFAMVVRRLN